MQQLTPTLRFPEFKGEWEEKAFGNIAKRKKERFNPKESEENYPCIELECLSQETGILLHTFDSITQKSIKNVFKENDILFGKLRPYLKKFLKPKFNGVCSSEIWVLQGKTINNEFLYVLIQTDKFNYEVNQTSGSKMPRADWAYISEINFSFPTLPEQEKIADFLSAVDNRVQNLEEKKSLIELYKKGLMQKIFSQELRFKDKKGNNFPEWEEKKLGDICVISKGKQLNKENLTEFGIYPCQNGGISPSGYTENYNTNANTITISEGGNSSGYINFMKTNFWCGGHCYALLDLLDSISKKYLFHNLTFNQNSIMRLRVGSGLPNIQKKDISQFKIDVPSIPEQEKIAHFLSAIDLKIENVNEQIEQSKSYKKGLLQQMFV